jgi:hypothetical protein
MTTTTTTPDSTTTFTETNLPVDMTPMPEL